jgi:acetyl esterase/lipase
VISIALAAALVCACSYDIDSPPPQAAHNQLDLYAPRVARRRPIVVYVHGGGWMEGDKRDGIRRKARLFTGAGYVFASVNYRLSSPAPESGELDPGRVKFPDHPHDVG